MRHILVFSGFILLFAAVASAGTGRAYWTFDADPVGGLPAGMHGFSGKWLVRAEANAPSRKYFSEDSTLPASRPGPGARGIVVGYDKASGYVLDAKRPNISRNMP